MDAEGIYENEQECRENCRSMPNVDTNLLALAYLPEAVLTLAPSERRSIANNQYRAGLQSQDDIDDFLYILSRTYDRLLDPITFEVPQLQPARDFGAVGVLPPEVSLQEVGEAVEIRDAMFQYPAITQALYPYFTPVDLFLQVALRNYLLPPSFTYQNYVDLRSEIDLCVRDIVANRQTRTSALRRAVIKLARLFLPKDLALGTQNLLTSTILETLDNGYGDLLTTYYR